MADSISNMDNVIDSRDVDERIADLEVYESAYKEAQDEVAQIEQALADIRNEREMSKGGPDESRIPQLDEKIAELEEALEEAKGTLTDVENDFDNDAEEELNALRELRDDAEGYSSDWRYGAQLINDEYFVKYAQELADDLGYIKRDVGWPYDCIDWDKAADALKNDYSCISFDGQDFWVR